MKNFKNYGLRENIPFSEISTFKIGGNVRYLVYPKNTKELKDCIEISKFQGLPYFFMGNGSNILCRDGGFNGVIISTLSLNKVIKNDNVLVSASGVSIYDLAEYAMISGLSGLEFAEGIPGTVGGAIFMNAGAYESAIENIIVSAEAMDSEGNIKKYSRSELELGKRHSVFRDNGEVILSGEFLLSKKNPSDITEKMNDFHNRRLEKQPLEFASAGSVFKRPEGHYAGKLIEDAGIKGLRFGDAQVSEKHAGFIVNRDKATAKEVLTLIETIQKIVKDTTGVTLEREVVIIGED